MGSIPIDNKKHSKRYPQSNNGDEKSVTSTWQLINNWKYTDFNFSHFLPKINFSVNLNFIIMAEYVGLSKPILINSQNVNVDYLYGPYTSNFTFNFLAKSTLVKEFFSL